MKVSLVICSLVIGACSSASPGLQADAAGTGGTTGAAGTGGMAGMGGSGGDGPRCTGALPLCGGGSQSACTITTPLVPSSPPAEVTTCDTNQFDPPVDECGCDGKACAAGETCTTVLRYLSGGPDFYANTCITPCVATTDCGPNDACLPDVFGSFECRPTQCGSDADCSRDTCGHCVAGFQGSHGVGNVARPNVHICVYEGMCAASSCAGCSVANAYLTTDLQPGYHTCPGS